MDTTDQELKIRLTKLGFKVSALDITLVSRKRVEQVENCIRDLRGKGFTAEEAFLTAIGA